MILFQFLCLFLSNPPKNIILGKFLQTQKWIVLRFPVLPASCLHFCQTILKILSPLLPSSFWLCYTGFQQMRSYIPKQTRSSSMKSTITDIARETGLSVSHILQIFKPKTCPTGKCPPHWGSHPPHGLYPQSHCPGTPLQEGTHGRSVIPPLGNELWGRIIYPIEDVLRAHGYMTVVCTASVDASKNNTGSSQPLLEFFQTIGSMVLSPLAALCQVP